jgi:hypothetical protein
MSLLLSPGQNCILVFDLVFLVRQSADGMCVIYGIMYIMKISVK